MKKEIDVQTYIAGEHMYPGARVRDTGHHPNMIYLEGSGNALEADVIGIVDPGYPEEDILIGTEVEVWMFPIKEDGDDPQMIDIRLDTDVIARLQEAARLAGTDLNTVIGVILSLKVVNDPSPQTPPKD